VTTATTTTATGTTNQTSELTRKRTIIKTLAYHKL